MIIDIVLGYIAPFLLLILAGYLLMTYRNENVKKWVDIAVKAVEQMYKESGQGLKKYAEVEAFILKKFNISKTDLKNLIESAVYEINKNKQ